MPKSTLPEPQPPHPYGPSAATEDVRDSAFLMRVLTESALAAAASAGVDPAALPVTWVTDRLRVAWECAPDGGRRDALLTCAERAVRAGVDVGVVAFGGDASRRPPVEVVASLVQGVLLAYVRDDLATAVAAGGPPTDGNLRPAAPWCPPVNASGRVASSTVDDFDLPEDAKMLVCVRLLVAAEVSVVDRNRAARLGAVETDGSG